MTTAATSRDKRYTLRALCRKCPFSTDVEPYLRAERAVEIADGLRRGGEFACHKTTVTETDDDGNDTRVDDPSRSRMCAGAMATLERDHLVGPNQMMRIAEHLGMYDPTALKAEDQPVHDGLDEWVRAHQVAEGLIPTVTSDDGEVIEFEHCGVVFDECCDPAGYGGMGGVARNSDPPTCNPLVDVCSACGQTVCETCRADGWGDPGEQLCRSCADDDTEEKD